MLTLKLIIWKVAWNTTTKLTDKKINRDRYKEKPASVLNYNKSKKF